MGRTHYVAGEFQMLVCVSRVARVLRGVSGSITRSGLSAALVSCLLVAITGMSSSSSVALPNSDFVTPATLASATTAPPTISATPGITTAPALDPTSDSVGATVAQFRVDEGGNATYSIPIQVSPGVAGVVPKLALTYNSRLSGGPVGPGFTIEGASQIARCRQSRESGDFMSGTTPIDGNPAPVNFTASDRYCLDGIRLLLTSGSYGTPTSTYAPENDPFTQVTQNASSFSVKRKDGTTSLYGDTTISPNSAPGASIAFTSFTVSWNLSRVQDSVGNYIDYLYTNQPAVGTLPFAAGAVEIVLSQINYTGHATSPVSAPYASVLFHYTTLPTARVRLGYQAGVAFLQSQQLTDVTVQDSTAASPTLRYYQLTYGTSVSGSNAQQLRQIQECRDSSLSVCFPPTLFTWSNAVNSFSPDSAQTQSGPDFTNLVSYKIADLDGDGRQDLVWAKNGDATCGSNSRIYVSFLDRTVSNQMTLVTPTQAVRCAPRNLLNDDLSWGLVDYDGDGRADLMIAGASSWSVYLSLGRPASPGAAVFSGTDQLASLSPAIPVISGSTHPGLTLDLNGDGIPDFIYPVTPSVSTGNASVMVRLLQRQPSGALAFSVPYAIDFNFTVGDGCASALGGPCDLNFFTGIGAFILGTEINGDGRGDLMFYVSQPCAGGICDTAPTTPATVSTSSPPTFNSILGTPADPHPDFATTKYYWYQFIADGTEPPASGSTVPRFKLTQYWSDLTTLSGGVLPDTSAGMHLADLNADGLTDIVYQDSTTPTTYWARLNTGVISQPSTLPPISTYKSPIAVTGIANSAQLQFADTNGDGRAELVFPTAASGTFNSVSLQPDGTFTAPTAVAGGGLTAGGNLNQWINLIGDFDADGTSDFLRINVASSSSNLYASRAPSGSRYHPRDVITSIRNGHGATTTLTYQPLTNKGVYQRGAENGLPALTLDNFGWGSPVFDVLAPLYVVSQASSSAPIRGSPSAQSTVAYRYAGALMQAGGRGFLGFYETWSFDANDQASTGQYVATVNSYTQAYPFIGMPEVSFQLVFNGALTRGTAELDACAANPEVAGYNCFAPVGAALWPDLLQSGQIVRYGGQQPVCNGAGCVAIDNSACTSTTHIDRPLGITDGLFTPPAVAQPIFSYISHSIDEQAELGGGPGPGSFVATAQSANYFCYEDGYGNLTHSRTETLDGSNTIVAQKLLTNTYTNDTGRWFLGRLTHSVVQFLRPSQATIARTTDYTYATTTGLLTSERLQSGGPADQDLRTLYTLDAYGNRTGAYQCSNDLTDSQCTSTSGFPQQPLNGSGHSGNLVHRYAKTSFDSIGRYTTGSRLPFYSVGGAGHLNEQTAVSTSTRDEFGNVTTQSTANGLIQSALFGSLGRPYFSEDNTGKASTTTFRQCTAVSCPSDTAFRVQTVTAGAPSSWTYNDLLGRPILKVTQSFDSNPSGQNFSGVCSYYDSHNRPAYQSEPFFVPATVSGDGSPTLTSSNPCAAAASSTTPAYDVLGRVTRVNNPDGGSVLKSYVGLTTFTTNPRGFTWEETKNPLGEVVETRDPTVSGDPTVGLVVSKTFNAAGDVLTVGRDAGNGPIVNSVTYDALGRKTGQVDPDAGSITYRYNATGDVVSQTDGKGQIVQQDYDAMGRCWRRTAPGSDGNILTDIWTFDTAANGLGQIASESRSATTGATFSRAITYDGYGRLNQRNTAIAGSAYNEVTGYDGYGRVQSQQDASGYTLTTNYTTNGYLGSLIDSRVGTLYQVLGMTARGQVTQEQRGTSSTLVSTLTYTPSTGRLNTLCSGISCALQDLRYSFDLAGNLTQRERAISTSPTVEANTYDALNRLKQSQLTRIQGVFQGTPWVTEQLVYDQLGNLCTKNGTSYTYTGLAGCTGHGSFGSPHAVSAIGAVGYAYDPNGSQTSGTDGRTLAYNALNQLASANTASAQTSFQYTPDGDRFLRVDATGAGSDRIFCNNFETTGCPSSPGGVTTNYIGNVEILRYAGGTTETRRYLAGVAIDYVRSSGSNETRYVFADHLGSTDVVANASGGVIEAMSFDPHGNRRDPNTWHGSAPVPVSTTTGFTGHEQVDSLNFVHMNGRIYDPQIGKMLQADPLSDGSPQGLNRYSYVINNPLTLTDPTGYSWWRDVLGVAIVVFLPELLPTWLPGWAAVGISGFAAGAVQSGSFKGAVYGAFSAELFYGIDQGFGSAGWAHDGGTIGSTNLNAVGFSAKILAHGVAGGVMQSLEGGKFGNGFLSAGVGEAASPGIDRLDPQNPIGQSVSAQRVIAAAVVGGTTSVLAGNKFGNGALTGAFGRAFNEERAKMHFPPFNKLQANYPRNDDGSPAHPSADPYPNQCAIRLGADLIDSGVDMSSYPQVNVTTDGYPRGVGTLMDWMTRQYGAPTETTFDYFYNKVYPTQQGIFVQFSYNSVGTNVGWTSFHIDIFYQGQAGSGLYGTPPQPTAKIAYWTIK